MNATDYWPFAQEYSIWNAAVTALQFWMADLDFLYRELYKDLHMEYFILLINF